MKLELPSHISLGKMYFLFLFFSYNFADELQICKSWVKKKKKNPDMLVYFIFVLQICAVKHSNEHRIYHMQVRLHIK